MKTWGWWVAAGLSAQALRAALARAEGLRWVYAERPEDVLLAAKAAWMSAEAPSFARWRYGRAFGPEAEWVWWRREDGFAVRAVVRGPQPPETSLPWRPWTTAVGWQPRSPIRYFLVGTLVSPDEADEEGLPWPLWRTLRIRRNFFYPLEDEGAAPPEQVALEVRPFVTAQGQPVAVQWRRVLGMEERDR